MSSRSRRSRPTSCSASSQNLGSGDTANSQEVRFNPNRMPAGMRTLSDCESEPRLSIFVKFFDLLVFSNQVPENR